MYSLAAQKVVPSVGSTTTRAVIADPEVLGEERRRPGPRQSELKWPDVSRVPTHIETNSVLDASIQVKPRLPLMSMATDGIWTDTPGPGSMTPCCDQRRRAARDVDLVVEALGIEEAVGGGAGCHGRDQHGRYGTGPGRSSCSGRSSRCRRAGSALHGGLIRRDRDRRVGERRAAAEVVGHLGDTHRVAAGIVAVGGDEPLDPARRVAVHLGRRHRPELGLGRARRSMVSVPASASALLIVAIVALPRRCRSR